MLGGLAERSDGTVLILFQRSIAGCSRSSQNTLNQRWYQAHDVAIPWENGELVRLEIAVDITDRKVAEAARERLEVQVQHAQTLESLGVLAGGIAHDFNNMLMAVLGNADLAL